MIIIGAGMAGLLAGNMLTRHKPKIVERAKSLPNNHSAVLRFRSSIVGDTLGIPFKKVEMIKCAANWKNPVADVMAYSYKNTGVWRSDRSISKGMVSEDRFIAPSNFIQLMADGLNINYETEFDFRGYEAGEPIISTIPMPVLMKVLGYSKTDLIFDYVSGATLKAKIRACDAYVSLLVPSPEYSFSRISITGDELFVEIHNTGGVVWDDSILAQVSELLGIPVHAFSDATIKQQQYSKIVPIHDDIRKHFMHWATTKFNVYSLGRFATWRPNLLLDDLVKDIRLIEKWVASGSKYDMAKVV